MAKVFCGQYLAAHGGTDGKPGFLMINVDPDRAGSGLAYVTSPGIGQAAIVRCEQVTVDDAGVMQGRGLRSEKHEKFHGIAHDGEEGAYTTRYSFVVQPRATGDELTILGDDGLKREVKLEPIASTSRVQAERLESWGHFKEWAAKIKSKDPGAIFRGVSRTSYELRTSFHRTGRVDLERFRDEDMPVFSDLAETIGGLRFDVGRDDVGAVWGYAQHHGFPTPLLDWTESPYIAAYFALAERLDENTELLDEFVRVYCLDGGFVTANCPMSVGMSDVFPRVWIFRPKSKGNQRLVFQQGVFLHSTVVAIEAYLLYWAQLRSIKTLSAVDIPAAVARAAIEEMGYMGVNPMSLFPGLDGAARFAAFKQFYRPL